ncbi:hypothetical protein ACOSQ3_004361 [Xanthoceras sorbifolium]
MSENGDSVKKNVQENSPFGSWMLVDKSGRNRASEKVSNRFMGNSGYSRRNNFRNKNFGAVSNNGKDRYNQGGQFGRSGIGSRYGGSNSGKGSILNHKFGVTSNLKVVNNSVFGDNGSGVKLSEGLRF